MKGHILLYTSEYIFNSKSKNDDTYYKHFIGHNLKLKNARATFLKFYCDDTMGERDSVRAQRSGR